MSLFGSTSTADPSGASTSSNGDVDPGAALRQSASELSSEPTKRGRGRPTGSKAKAKPDSPAPVPPQAPATPESFYRKMGYVHRVAANAAALSTNCSVWVLDEKQEKDLGEALGDVLYSLGLADTLAVKISVLMGVEAAIWLPKFVGYRIFRQELAEEARKQAKNPVSDPGQDQKKADPYITAPGLL